MSGGGGGGGGGGTAQPTVTDPGFAGLQAGGGLRLTPAMLGLPTEGYTYPDRGPISPYGAGTLRVGGQNINFTGGSREDMQNAMALAYMYSNLNRLGYMQPQGGTPMPQAAPVPAPMPQQPTLAPPPTGPSVPAMAPLMPYASMLRQVQGVNTKGLPADMAAAIPAYLRRGA